MITKADCPFCHHPITVRGRGPWPLQRHDVNGHAVAYIGRPCFRLCAGSRAVLPLYANPWARMARTQEHPVHLTVYREVEADHVKPGDVIDYDGPLPIETVEHHLNGVRLLGRRRPSSRRTPVQCKPGERLRVFPTPAQEVEAWEMLNAAVTDTASAWRRNEQDVAEPGADLVAAPVESSDIAGNLQIEAALRDGCFTLRHDTPVTPEEPATPSPVDLDQDYEPIAVDG